MRAQWFPRLPVRQWVLSVPKRLRYFLQRDTALQGAVLRIFLRGAERCLREHSPGCGISARIGAVAFTRVRVRSARRLVTSNFLITLGWLVRRV